MTISSRNDPTNFCLCLGAFSVFTYALPDNVRALASLASSTCTPIITTAQEPNILSSLACGAVKTTSVLYKASFAAMTLVTIYEGLVLSGYDKRIMNHAKSLSSYLFTYTK